MATVKQLRAQAKALFITGYSSMKKAELEKIISDIQKSVDTLDEVEAQIAANSQPEQATSNQPTSYITYSGVSISHEDYLNAMVPSYVKKGNALYESIKNADCIQTVTALVEAVCGRDSLRQCARRLSIDVKHLDKNFTSSDIYKELIISKAQELFSTQAEAVSSATSENIEVKETRAGTWTDIYVDTARGMIWRVCKAGDTIENCPDFLAWNKKQAELGKSPYFNRIAGESRVAAESTLMDWPTKMNTDEMRKLCMICGIKGYARITRKAMCSAILDFAESKGVLKSAPVQNDEYSPEFEEECCVPDYQANNAVLDDIPEPHLTISADIQELKNIPAVIIHAEGKLPAPQIVRGKPTPKDRKHIFDFSTCKDAKTLYKMLNAGSPEAVKFIAESYREFQPLADAKKMNKKFYINAIVKLYFPEAEIPAEATPKQTRRPAYISCKFEKDKVYVWPVWGKTGVYRMFKVLKRTQNKVTIAEVNPYDFMEFFGLPMTLSVKYSNAGNEHITPGRKWEHDLCASDEYNRVYMVVYYTPGCDVDFDETAYVPDFQENPAVLDDIPEDHEQEHQLDATPKSKSPVTLPTLEKCPHCGSKRKPYFSYKTENNYSYTRHHFGEGPAEWKCATLTCRDCGHREYICFSTPYPEREEAMKKIVGKWCLKSTLSKTNKKQEHQPAPVKPEHQQETTERENPQLENFFGCRCIHDIQAEWFNMGMVKKCDTPEKLDALLRTGNKSTLWFIGSKLGAISKDNHSSAYFDGHNEEFFIRLCVVHIFPKYEYNAEPEVIHQQASKPAARKPRQVKNTDDTRQIFIQFDTEYIPAPASATVHTAKPKTVRRPRVMRDYSRQLMLAFDAPEILSGKPDNREAA